MQKAVVVSGDEVQSDSALDRVKRFTFGEALREDVECRRVTDEDVRDVIPPDTGPQMSLETLGRRVRGEIDFHVDAGRSITQRGVALQPCGSSRATQ